MFPLFSLEEEWIYKLSKHFSKPLRYERKQKTQQQAYSPLDYQTRLDLLAYLTTHSPYFATSTNMALLHLTTLTTYTFSSVRIASQGQSSQLQVPKQEQTQDDAGNENTRSNESESPAYSYVQLSPVPSTTSTIVRPSHPEPKMARHGRREHSACRRVARADGGATRRAGSSVQPRQGRAELGR